MANGNDDSDGPSSFLVGISSFLVMALFVPGAISAFFVLWLIHGESITEYFASEKCTFTGGIAAALFAGLILTPFAFICERPLRFIRVVIQWALRVNSSSSPNYFVLTKEIIRWENKGLTGWYFFQVWGQFIMHWNIALSLTPIAFWYIRHGFTSGHLTFHGNLYDIDLKTAVILFTIVVNIICSTLFECAHKDNVEAMEKLEEEQQKQKLEKGNNRS